MELCEAVGELRRFSGYCHKNATFGVEHAAREQQPQEGN
jgi:hypothetical protein